MPLFGFLYVCMNVCMCGWVGESGCDFLSFFFVLLFGVYFFTATASY